LHIACSIFQCVAEVQIVCVSLLYDSVCWSVECVAICYKGLDRVDVYVLCVCVFEHLHAKCGVLGCEPTGRCRDETPREQFDVGNSGVDGVPNAQAAAGVQLLTGLYLFKYMQSLVRVFSEVFWCLLYVCFDVFRSLLT